MQIQKARRYFAVSVVSALLLLILTGCFQQAGTGTRPEAVSQALPSPTPFIPSPTPEPTEEQVLEFPTEEIVEPEFTEELVPTIDPLDPLLQTTPEVEEPLIETETATPTEFPTQEPTKAPTETKVALLVTEATEDPLLPLVIFSTETPTEEPSATATPSPTETPLGLIPLTETPTLAFTFPTPFPTTTPAAVAQAIEETPDDLMMTATAVRLYATQTESANQTATAGALFPITTEPPAIIATTDPGIGVPFATNTPGIIPPIAPGADCVHEVRIGENLFRLSLLYGVTIDQIAARNGIVNINVIVVGQRITIPGCGTTGATPPPTSVGTSTPGTGGPITGTVHVVRQGETLFQISLQYGTTVEAIAAANGISNINVIFIGQQLVIR